MEAIARSSHSGHLHSRLANPVRSRLANLFTVMLIVVVGALHFATLRAGHPWGDDFALYVSEARNIAEGRDYGDTGYVYNTFLPSLSPRVYPPVFPLMLAPVYRLCGVDLNSLKAVGIVSFLGFLAACAWGFRSRLSPGLALLLIALIGFHPGFYSFKDNILSDVPFLLWTYACLFAIDAGPRAGTLGQPFRRAILIGVLMYLAFGTRSVGIVLVPCLWLTDVIQWRRITRSTFVATTVFAVLALLQAALVGSTSSYLDQLTHNSIKVVTFNIAEYSKAALYLWPGALPKAFRVAVLAVIGLLALAGYRVRFRAGAGVFEVFGPLYASVILLWPSYQGERFVFPLLPLTLYYAVVALAEQARRWSFAQARSARATLLASFAILYGGAYAVAESGPFPEGVGKAESQDLFHYIRAYTPSDAVVIFRKPRALALFTGRSASSYHFDMTDVQFWTYLRQIGASYIVVGTLDEIDFVADRQILLPFIDRHASAFREVHANRDFRVFRLLSSDDSAAPPARPASASR